MAGKPRSSWLVLHVRCPSAEHAALLAEGLFAFGAQAVHEKPDEVVTWLPAPAQPVEPYVDDLRTHLSALTGQDRIDVQWDWEPDRDWAEEWKRGLGARRVGERLVVTPSWITPRLQPSDIVITIDPQMAFGTGEHASTRGALRLLERALRPDDRVIDVGCGSAILAIAAAKLGAAEVLAVELDADSVLNARENIVRNQVGAQIRIDCAAVDAAYLEQAGRFDLILANILSGVILPLLPAFAGALRSDGGAVVAGILQEEAEQVRAAAEHNGFVVTAEDREAEWWSALLRPAAAAKSAR